MRLLARAVHRARQTSCQSAPADRVPRARQHTPPASVTPMRHVRCAGSDTARHGVRRTCGAMLAAMTFGAERRAVGPSTRRRPRWRRAPDARPWRDGRAMDAATRAQNSEPSAHRRGDARAGVGGAGASADETADRTPATARRLARRPASGARGLARSRTRRRFSPRPPRAPAPRTSAARRPGTSPGTPRARGSRRPSAPPTRRRRRRAADRRRGRPRWSAA